jgi:hypothetical protein
MQKQILKMEESGDNYKMLDVHCKTYNLLLDEHTLRGFNKAMI